MPRTPMPPWPKRRRTMTLAALTGTRCERTAHARLSLAKYVRSWSEKIVDRLSRAQRVRLFRRPAVEMLLRCLGIDRKSVVSGKRVSVRVDLGGRRIIKKKN